MKNKTAFTFIDLFAGIGGFRIALEEAGGHCVFFSEWDKNAQQTYAANFGEIPAGDIRKIKAKDIPAHNILCAGFPCQAFSISGKQKGFNDTRGTLFFEIARIAGLHQPDILFLENVSNFAKHDNGRTLQTVKRVLTELGYDLHYKVLNASDYSVPTSRKRIYMVGFKKSLHIHNFEFPKPLNQNTKLEDFLEPSDPNIESLVINRPDIKLTNKIVVPDLLGNYPQKPIRIGTINNGGQGERIYSIKGHAITLSAYGGGAGSKTGAYLINGVVRKLTPRECANIMGFPKIFKIPVSIAQAHKQFGNSVAIPVIRAILVEILKRYYGKQN